MIDDDLYQFQKIQPPLGSILAHSQYFSEIDRNDKVEKSLFINSMKQRHIHQKQIDQMFSKMSRAQSPTQQKHSQQNKKEIHQLDNFNQDRDFGWSMRIIERNVNVEIEKTLETTRTDIKALIQKQFQNQTIRNLTTFESVFQKAHRELRQKNYQNKLFKSKFSPVPCEIPKQTLSTTCQSETINSGIKFLGSQFIQKKRQKTNKRKKLLENYLDSSISSGMRVQTESSKVVKPIINSSRSQNSQLYNQNEKLLQPLKQLMKQQMQGNVQPNQREMTQLQNSIGVLTLCSDLRYSIPDVQSFKFQKKSKYFALPQIKPTTKKNILSKMQNNNLDTEFMPDFWYEFSNDQEIQEYLQEKVN